MVPPKITQRRIVLDGEKVNITIVRNSILCRCLSKKKVMVVGHTIYCAGWYVSLKELFRAGSELKAKRSWVDKLFNLMYF